MTSVACWRTDSEMLEREVAAWLWDEVVGPLKAGTT
jgi:hypothetical protein